MQRRQFESPSGQPSSDGPAGWLDAVIERLAPCPWTAHAGYHIVESGPAPTFQRPSLYTAEERRRRDATPWTLVQGVLAPLQFLVFLISLGLVIRYLATGAGQAEATLSVLVKTGVLYVIMITGSIWEKAVFGRWLFAPAFLWEDVVSMGVMALHTAYVAALLLGWGSPAEQMAIALAAYAIYAVNAAQFVIKLRQARLEAPGAAAA